MQQQQQQHWPAASSGGRRSDWRQRDTAWSASVDEQLNILRDAASRTAAVLERMDERQKNSDERVAELRAQLAKQPDQLRAWVGEGGGCAYMLLSAGLSALAFVVSLTSVLYLIFHH